MSRIKDLQKYVHHVVEGNEKEANQIAHLHGVALAATILAKKRGEDAELATMAGLLHDLHAYKSGSYDDHAHPWCGLCQEGTEEAGDYDRRRNRDHRVMLAL